MSSHPTIPGLNFPIFNIFCIGRNYAEHAKELRNDIPTSPLIFSKTLNTICETNSAIDLPEQSVDIHHEVEVVVAIGKKGKNINENDALNYIAGIGIGIDFTARDIQQVAKTKGHPWTVAKNFDGFAPIGSFSKLNSSISIHELEFSLSVNGEIRQNGNTSNMIFSIPFLISELSKIFTLNEGDLIFTGTPKGVSKVNSGDQISAILHPKLSELSINIK